MSGKRRLRQMFNSFSFSGCLYFLFLKIRRKELITGGICNGCGRCCRCISLHNGERWLRSEKEFDQLVKEQPEFGRFTLIGTDSDGFLVFSCSLTTKEGLCGDYDNRLPLCRNFPEKTLPFCGGELPKGCGYYFQEVVPFAKILQQECKR